MPIQEEELTAFRALSLKQPWLHMITHAPAGFEKRVENRTRRIMNWREYPRREVLLHASKGEPKSEWAAARAHIAKHLPDILSWFDNLDPRNVARGGIVARVRFTGMVDTRGHVQLEPGETAVPDLRWHIPGQYAYVLADVRITPFSHCAGALGFWRVPRSVMNLLL